MMYRFFEINMSFCSKKQRELIQAPNRYKSFQHQTILSQFNNSLMMVISIMIYYISLILLLFLTIFCVSLN